MVEGGEGISVAKCKIGNICVLVNFMDNVYRNKVVAHMTNKNDRYVLVIDGCSLPIGRLVMVVFLFSSYAYKIACQTLLLLLTK